MFDQYNWDMNCDLCVIIKCQFDIGEYVIWDLHDLDRLPSNLHDDKTMTWVWTTTFLQE